MSDSTELAKVSSILKACDFCGLVVLRYFSQTKASKPLPQCDPGNPEPARRADLIAARQLDRLFEKFAFEYADQFSVNLS